MHTRFGASCALVVAVAATIACSGGGSSGPGADGGNGGGGGNSGVTFSCTQAGVDCLQATALPGEIAAEQSACTKSYGTFAQAPCPSGGYVGCCDVTSGGGTLQCYFPSPAASTFVQLCANQGGTWQPGDAGAPDDGGSADGATGPPAFVGTWQRAGSQTVTCPTGNPVTSTLTGDVVIALGSTSDTISVAQPDGCSTSYTVAGNVATATAGQVCATTTEAGVAETITVQSHTLTLSADGQSIDSESTATIDKTATGTTCSDVGSATFTKV